MCARARAGPPTVAVDSPSNCASAIWSPSARASPTLAQFDGCGSVREAEEILTGKLLTNRAYLVYVP